MEDAETLHPSTRNFRVLDLLPGDPGDEVKCNTRVVSLDQGVSYEALSYVWGDPLATINVRVSENLISITQSLHYALVRLRYRNISRVLWIDQLCINQWDIDEKASHVAIMRDIYRQCSHCILWLGEIPCSTGGFAQEDAEAVFEFIRSVAALPEPELVSCKCCETEDPTLFCHCPHGTAARKAFAAFAMYGNAWWERIWTLQEFVLPRSAEFFWGDLSVARKDVIRMTQRLRSDRLVSFPTSFRNNRIRHIPLLRCLFYPIHGLLRARDSVDGPLDLCMRWLYRKATDPRDTVYALLGLLPISVLPSAQPCSYSITAGDLFRNVTLDHIRLENSLRALLASSELEHITLDLPTWAIDFACCHQVGMRQLKWWNHSHRYQQFAACGSHELQLAALDQNRVIALTGVFVDEIREVSDVYAVPNNEPLEHRRVFKTAMNAKDLVKRHATSWTAVDGYPGGGSWNSAYWRTMIGDLIMTEFPVERAKPCHEELFEELLARMSTQVPTRSPLCESLCGMVPNHAFFITKAGYIGMGPPQTLPGDRIWVLYGSRVPFVMRKVKPSENDDDPPHLTLVGDAYLHGIMDGEAVSDTHRSRTIWLY